MKELKEYKAEFERIINQEEKDKKHQLYRLLYETAQSFDIPLNPSEEFKEKNKDVMEVFYEIAETIRNTPFDN